MPAPLANRHIGLLTNWASRSNGGVFEAVIIQADIIRHLGGKVTIFALSDPFLEADRHRFGDATVIGCPVVGPGQVGFSPGLERAFDAAEVDGLHQHGIWMYPSRAGSNWAARTGKPYFVSPHGMLAPWITGRGRAKKAMARWAYERTNWRRATAMHALTRSEAQDIARESGRDSLIIPNAGARMADPCAFGAPVVLYIGRIHAKKNLLPLIAAWHDLARRGAHPADARLVICGWGEDSDVQAVSAAAAAGPGRIELPGPVYNEAKSALIAQARFVILPSLSEGLPMSILESWASGVPTIMSPECNLPEGFEQGAALECGTDAASIAHALQAGWAMDAAAWSAMQAKALTLAANQFSFDVVAHQWGQAYACALADQR